MPSSMSAGPDCSVIVISFNDQARLPRAVGSVLAQSLRNLEVIIVDDASTDDTEVVARGITASDERVSYLRLPRNSGGCGAPRNAGLDRARAPYVMFLDSDDELPKHACKSLLLEIERTGADFVTGEVERVFEASGKTGLWYPHLFATQRTLFGVNEDLELLFDGLSTNKIYRREFLDTHGLRFREDMHHEDMLWAIQAYALAKRISLVPWVVYRWNLAAISTSISSGRHKLSNVAERVNAARLVDDFLSASGRLDLKEAKDFRFLRHDLRLYLGDLPQRDQEWAAGFTEIVVPYLETLEPSAIQRLRRTERVCVQLLRRGRLTEAVDAARSLDSRVPLPPRFTTDGYWGPSAPTDEADRRELDIGELHLGDRPISAAALRHEATVVGASRGLLRLRIHTYDPGGALAGAEFAAKVEVAARTGSPRSFTLPLAATTEGVYEADVEIDLHRVPYGRIGTDRRCFPAVVIRRSGHANRADVIVADTTRSPYELRIDGHAITVSRADETPARLEITWRRQGWLAAARHLQSLRAGLRRRWYQLQREPYQRAVYELAAKLPVRKDLAVFESTGAKAYDGSPRAIYEELRRQNLRLDVVWSYRGSPSGYPSDATVVRRFSWRYVWSLGRARYWVDSHNVHPMFSDRSDVRYLQTWHGQGMKTIGLESPDLRGAAESVRNRYRRQVARWDVLISPSEEFEKTFVPANEFAGEILRVGTPANDVLTNPSAANAARVRRELEIPDGRRVLLYAPTYRDSAKKTGQSVRADLDLMASELAGEWVVIVRTHPYDEFSVPAHLSHFLRDGVGYAPLTDLMIASDALLSDYSSIVWDYAVLGRPILLYTDDYEEYRADDRGIYYDLREFAPGPMLTSTFELVAALRELDSVAASYAPAYQRFREWWCADETGKASQAVVDAFFREVAR